MTPELRTYLYKRLVDRSTKLAKAASLNNPIDAITTMFAEHVLDTCVLLLGADFQKTILDRVFDDKCEAHGICRFCNERKLISRDKGMCQVCWDQAEEEDSKDD